METAGPGNPLRLEFEAPLTIARWRPLVNFILAIPQLIVSAALRYVRQVLQLISFFAVLFTKQIPKGIFDLIVMSYRYEWRVNTFAFWLRESYPPFSFTMTAQDDGIDPASLTIEYPATLNRWMPLVKWFLAIPHYIVLFFLYVVAVLIVFVSIFAVLFTGRYPKGMRDFIVGVARWSTRVSAYVAFLTDQYPPFSLT
jgi:hypothetical protein